MYYPVKEDINNRNISGFVNLGSVFLRKEEMEKIEVNLLRRNKGSQIYACKMPLLMRLNWNSK